MRVRKTSPLRFRLNLKQKLRHLFRWFLLWGHKTHRAVSPVVAKSHAHLYKKSGLYRKVYDKNRFFRFRYGAPLFLLIAAGLIVTIYVQVQAAPDQASTWDFSTPSDYTMSSGVQTNGTSVQLRPYELAADANTSALYHFNETSGNTAADTSGNNNTLTSTVGSPWTTGRAYNGVGLNGTSTSLSVPDSSSLSLTSNQSIETSLKLTTPFSTSSQSDQYIVDKGNYKLYFNHNTGKLTYELAASSNVRDVSDSSQPWTQNSGALVYITSQVVYGSDVYYNMASISQTGNTTGSTWRYDSATNTTVQIGAAYYPSGGSKSTAMATNGATLYISISSYTTQSVVYSCDMSSGCLTWTSLGGFVTSNGIGVTSLLYQTSHLYATTSGGGDGSQVYVYASGTSWTKIGGTGSSPASWTSSSYAGAAYLTGNGTDTIYVGVWSGLYSSTVQIWKCVISGSTCTSWTQINTSWSSSPATEYRAPLVEMTYFGGNLYAAVTGNSVGAIYRYSGTGTTWVQLTNPWATASTAPMAMSNDGTNLYIAAYLDTPPSGDIWRCSTPTATCSGGWTAINNTVGNAQHAMTMQLTYSGTSLYAAGRTLAEAAGYSAKYTAGSWQELAKSATWGSSKFTSAQSMTNYKGDLYVGVGMKDSESSGFRGTAVYRRQGTTWSEVGGNGLKNSWNNGTGQYNAVNAMAVYGGNLYVAIGGLAAGDSEVWKFDGTTWTKVGGDGVNSSWNTNFEDAKSLAVYNGQLYAGLGRSAGDGEVWKFDGTSWTKVGGSGLNGSWTATDTVSSMVVSSGQLYVGLGGTGSTMGRIYTYNGSAWVQIAGNGALSGNWASAYDVASLVVYNGQVYAGLQWASSGAATIWRYSGAGTSWTQVAGSGLAGSWTTQYLNVTTMAVYNGQLYAGLNLTTPLYSTAAGDLWKYSGGSWSSLGFGSNIQSLFVDGGRLRVGYNGYQEDSESGYKASLAMVASYGNNTVLATSASSWDTSWHKIAASYDGTTMKVYVDGTLNASLAATTTVPDNDLPLVIGGSYDGINSPSGYVNGTLDELRLSNIARASFPDLLFSNTAQTVTLASAARKRGVWHWDDWADNRTMAGGSLTYRLSIDGGATWQWWNGSAWTASAQTSQSNDVATLHSHIATLPVSFGGITWQAVFLGDGTQQITLNNVTLSSTSDTTIPTANATGLQAKKAAANSSFDLSTDAWTNSASPYFNWTAGTDTESGVMGYCLYLGQDSTADPVTTKGLLGNSPVSTGGNCQFLVAGTSLDLGSAGSLATPLSSSNTPYYLLIKAIDNAGNIVGATSEFHFKFDNTPPTTPAYITAPSGFINTKEVTLSWPTIGSSSAADANSGLVGLQYKINNSPWYGSSHTGTGDINDILPSASGSYTMAPTPDFPNLTEGINTVYFRAWDNAGNVSSALINAVVRINTTGAPSQPLIAVATPATNTTNSFAFAWNAPSTFVGDASNITYCYTINTTPNDSNCTYTPAGATSLVAGPYATQPGTNTLYLVARDESHNINYANYASVDFSANTPAPGIPLNADVADVSVKTTNNWRLALTWDTPSDVGAGVTQYKVYRSTDGVHYNVIGTSSSTSYIDSSLTQRDYYYRVNACDSANNCGADSSIAKGYPTGKFTAPANLISGQPAVTDTTTRTATISWVTDRASDSRLSIGTTSGVYEPPETLLSAQVVNHKVQLSNLSAGTTYYVVAKWTDEDGNMGKSQEFSFTTKPAPTVKEVTTTKVGLSDAIINFTSLGAYRISISYGISDSFGGIKSLNTSASQSSYDISLDGLNDGTKYFFQPVAYDGEGNAYPGNIFSFTTPERPRISNLQFQPVAGEPTSTQEVSWKTNVPTDSTVTYGTVDSSGTDITKPQMTTDHKLVINGLEDNSSYFLIAESRDVNGNLAVSDKQFFRTALDTRPPKISAITVETSIRGTGSQSRGQIIVSWTTDELATSQVAYGTGTSTETLNNKTAEDGALSTEHIVIISDLPTSELYTIQPISKDKSGNQQPGTSQTAIIGRGSDDVLTIVLNAIQKMFGI